MAYSVDNNIPQISLYYQPVIGDSIPEINRQDWEVSYNLGKNWRQATKGKKKNGSLFKVDIVVYPELYFKNVVITQIYQVLFNLSPAIEVSLWKGMKLTAQMILPIYNDGYPNGYKKVRPGFVELAQSVRLPYNTFARLAIGHFNNDRFV